MSQGLIRLRKVKGGPARAMSIMKTSGYKKQLSVRFQDQKPIETIKNLSQDMDEISQVIDAYFPLRNPEMNKNANFQSKDLPSSLKSPSENQKIFSNSIESGSCFYCHSKLRPIDKIVLAAQEKKEGRKINETPDIQKSAEVEVNLKYRNLAAKELQGNEIRIVKHGRTFNSLDKGNKKDINSDLATPKIVKFSGPTYKVSKAKKKSKKDVIVLV